MIATNIAPPVQTEPQLFIVGPSNLQTKILSSIIAQQLLCECLVLSPEDMLQHPALGLEPNLVLVDCHSSNLNEVHDLVAKLQSHAETASIALFNIPEQSRFDEFAEWPLVNGIFYDQIDHEQLIKGLQELRTGGYWLPRNIMHRILKKQRREPIRDDALSNLTKREKQILSLLAEGSTNQQIANNLHVSDHTVKSHLYNIYRKINVANRLQACNWAKQCLQQG